MTALAIFLLTFVVSLGIWMLDDRLTRIINAIEKSRAEEPR